MKESIYLYIYKWRIKWLSELLINSERRYGGSISRNKSVQKSGWCWQLICTSVAKGFAGILVQYDKPTERI